ncbi:MAG TPA: Hsp33 family molecular chaperone HslO [Ramlibacter sp.]|uniref:Hsp33 family molecular chaperone HslO n=1 Tax=Ramlibacter sp. TaxID=1917967 RepID=UPI002CAF6491|nr:Hsp33 family molecular chaperone HslO [Ramlibacter sp.]HVZ46294.1 Hsp33 family molecular chaperone HslO [Ramlibacter sp.]
MSELHKFLFDGLPVRGMIVRLTDAWQDILQRRRTNENTGPWPEPVAELLGEMAAAGALMQSNIKFNGALVMQIYGDGPVKVCVAEVQHDLGLRVTAKVVGDVPASAGLADLVNANGGGRCAITLDPKDRQPGLQPYQGVVPLRGPHGERLDRISDVLEHYMRQSEQLDAKLVLAADQRVAAGLMIQRLPLEGERNLREMSEMSERGGKDEHAARFEDFHRIATLAASLTPRELLELDVETVLRRLFWEEKLLRFEPETPRFACTCSRERVAGMIRGLGREEAESILAERDQIDVACDFCGQHYQFDAVDAARIFTAPGDQPPVSSAMQ